MKEFNPKSKGGLVADVDCTASGKSLCEKMNISGYPTIKWGPPNNLQDYDGGRDYEELKQFADENLKAVCGPESLEQCSEEEAAAIRKVQKMSYGDLIKKITAEEKKIEQAELKFNNESDKLREAYEKLDKEKKATIDAVKKGGLGLMKSVIATLLPPGWTEHSSKKGKKYYYNKKSKKTQWKRPKYEPPVKSAAGAADPNADLAPGEENYDDTKEEL